MTATLGIIERMILVYFFLVNVVYLVLLAFAAIQLWIDSRIDWMEYRVWRSPRTFVPRISVIAPAHNEARTIVESVRALLALWYANLEIIVVDDGSTDDTLAVLIDTFGLVPIPTVYESRLVTKPVRALYRSSQYPHLVVMRKAGGGKADALNAGVNVASGDLICSIDADTLIEADALQRMVRPFLLYDEVIAVGGTIRPVNECTVVSHRVERAVCPSSWLAGIQVVEYLRAFLFGRLGWNWLGGNLIISGAFGLFRREALLAAGGYLCDTVGEDMELIVRLRRHCREHGRLDRVVFIPDPVAWTEVPSSLPTLARQRERWHRGLADVLWRHRRLWGNPRYGLLGLVVVPCFFVVELLAPVVETVGIGVAAIAYLFDQLNVSFAVWFFLVAYGFGMLLSLASLVLEEWRFARFASWHDRVRFVVWAVLEYIGYHQLTVWFRLRGLLRFLKGRKDWGGHAPAGIWLAGSEALHPVRTYAGGNGLLPPASVRERRLMLSKLNVIQWGIVGVTSLGLGVGSGWAEETIALTQAIPDNLARIEVVWPTGGPPSVTLNPPVEPQSIGSIRWTGTRVTVVPLAEQMRPFGACQVRIEKLGEAIRLQMEGTPKPTCGVIWWLGHPDAALDLLSFNQLSVEGIARGSFDLGIVDRWWWEKQDSMTLFRTTGSFRIGIPLSAIADRVDLRQVVALTVAVSRTPAVVTIEPVRFEARKLAPPAPKLGLWVWNVRRAIQEPDQVLSTCVAMGCRRVSIQMPGANATEETWRAYLAVVRRWQEQGIEVYALDGDPHAVVNPRYLVAGIERLTTTGKGETLPTGLQLDIEPYVLQEFQTDPERYRDYLTLLAQLRRTMPAGLPLSVVVPFWFSGLMVEGRPLAFHVQDLADEVVVMNYRVELSEARRLIEDWVRYGALIGKPVWGAIETRPLPDERHLVFRRVERPEQATAYLDRCAQQLVLAPPPQKAAHLLYFAEMVRYDVLGSRLSFAGRSKEALKTALDQWVRDVTVPTVTGLMIHDWEGYEQLFDGPPRQPAGPH